MENKVKEGGKPINYVIANCQGLGLQLADGLCRINSELYDLSSDSEIIYIVSDNGAVICTVLGDRIQYENPVNYDRRTSNTQNGFRIIWSQTGNSCLIYRTVQTKKKKGSTLPIIFGSLVGFIIGFIFTAFCFALTDESNPTPPTPTDEDTVEVVRVVVEDADLDQRNLLKEAEKRQKKLQSNNCDSLTVVRVTTWWNNLQTSDKYYLTANYNYDFPKALDAYGAFFKAWNMNDVRLAYDKGKPYFSSEQLDIIKEEYLSSERRFNEVLGSGFEANEVVHSACME